MSGTVSCRRKIVVSVTKDSEDKQVDPTTPEQPAAPAAPAPEPAPEPVSYDLKFEDGVEVDRDGIVAHAKQHGLSVEQAQALADRESENFRQAEKKQAELRDSLKSQWLEASKADAEFGGDKLEPALSVARGVLEKFGSKELRDALNDTGLGNHPEMLRLLKKVGDAFADDKFVRAEEPAVKKEPRSIAERLYAKKE